MTRAGATFRGNLGDGRGDNWHGARRLLRRVLLTRAVALISAAVTLISSVHTVVVTLILSATCSFGVVVLILPVLTEWCRVRWIESVGH